MDNLVETSVRGEWKGKTAVSCDYSCAWHLHMHGLRLPMMIAWYKPRKYEFGFISCKYSQHGIAQWRQASNGVYLNLWLIQIWASLCVTGRDSIEYLWGVLYYVLLHVLNHYNIQIVWGFQLYAFPRLHTVLMCACDWCFTVFNTAKLMINVEEVMYYACIPK